MNFPKLSIIIPVYNGADTIRETIQSVLAQTYDNFELIIVDDISKDHSLDIVRQFQDPRIQILCQERNLGANAARNKGVRSASGDIIAFLDQDDLFHPEKLKVHVSYLTSHPDVGFCFNPRFELNHSSTTIRELFRPPDQLTLEHLLYDYPMSPSDMVLTRDWAMRAEGWDEAGIVNGAEITYTGRLYLSGCKFANVGKALNYRRYYSDRKFGNLLEKCRSEIEAREKIFRHPSCPKDVMAFRSHALVNALVGFSSLAFAQDETTLGQQLLLEAVRFDQSIITGQNSRYIHSLIHFSILDESQDHILLMKKILQQLPAEASHVNQYLEWAAGQGFLQKGGRAALWGRVEAGREFCSQASALGAEAGPAYFSYLSAHLLNYEAEFGPAAAREALDRVASCLEPAVKRAAVRQLKGSYLLSRAFRSYSKKEFSRVPGDVFRAASNQGEIVFNRGAWSIFTRSVLQEAAGKISGHTPELKGGRN